MSIITEKELLSSESVRTYKRLLNGDIRNFPPMFFAPSTRKRRIQQLITYLVEHLLQITPEQAYEFLDKATLKQYKLDILLRYVDDFPEKNDKRSVQFLLRMVYPHLPEETFEELVTSVYQEVLDGKRRSFPTNYFHGTIGEKRAIVCVRYLCENVLKLDEHLIPKVLNRELLVKYKLKILLTLYFDSVFDLVITAYPQFEAKDFR